METFEISEKKKKQTKALYVGVIIILVLIFVVGFIWGLNKVLALEGAFPPNELTEGLSPAPQNAAQAVDFLNRTVDGAAELKPYMKKAVDFGIGDDIDAPDDAMKQTLTLIRSSLEDTLDKQFETVERGFGEGFEDVLSKPGIVASDVESLTCSYIYYTCPSCGATSEEPLDHCEPCGYEYPYNMSYRDQYDIKLELLETDDVLNGNFSPRSEEEIIALFGDGLDGVCTVDSVSVVYDALEMQYKVDRLRDELDYLGYRKNMTVTVDVTFTGEYESLGSMSFTAPVTEAEHYDFTWPSLELNKHVMSAEPKSTENLLATKTCDSPETVEVRWSSSDESVLTVDDEGYFKAGKEPGSAVITAEFDFQGKTYSDACTVNVKYSVESSAMNKKKVKLSAGETYQLSVKVGPSNATYKTVTWHTEDDNIARVDDNGLVTGVAPGKVIIYSLTDDGYFKSTCEVTVS